MSKAEKSTSLLENFASIFYISKVLGVYPHDFRKFKDDKQLQKSTVGSCVAIAVMIIVFVFFNLMVYIFQDMQFSAGLNNLSIAIGFVLTYIGPAMMIIDQLTAIRNQQALAALFECIGHIDEGLREQSITVHNQPIKLRILFMILLTVSCELLTFLLSYIFILNRMEWISGLWIVCNIPTFFNSLDKIWFMGLLLSLKERFRLINAALEATAEEHSQYLKEREKMLKVKYVADVLLEDTLFVDSAFNESISTAEKFDIFGENVRTIKPKTQKPQELKLIYESELSNVAGIRERFVRLCQLHDGICTAAKQLNELWCYPMLILMAYGFLIFTAQLYFLYCAAENMAVPSIFRSTKQILITMIHLFYISGKCVAIIYFSWKTSLEAKRTGVCLHKCGVAADTNEIYEIVNHLSLKLLNHSVNFSACGFFTLNMETLFAVCGAITSYLIILIQFNMAGEQAKAAKNLAKLNSSELLYLSAENTTNMLEELLFLN